MDDSSRYRWLVLFVCLSGLFGVGFTITILSASIPRIAGDLDSSVSTITWVITAPVLAFGVIGPAVGKAGDLFGHRRIYVIGLAGAGLFALGVAAAPNALWLIVARTLSAGAGAATGPAAMAMINRVFPREERVRAIGYWSLVSAGSPVIGVVVGGPLVDAVGWRWIFVVQAPMCLLGAVAGALLLPETEPIPGAPFDWKGAGVLAASVTSILFAVNRGNDWGWTSTPIIALVVLGLALGVVLFRVERDAVEPLFPMRYLKRRNFTIPIAHQSLSNFAYLGGFVLAPLLMSEVLGYDSSRISWLLIARPLAFALASPMGAFFVRQLGVRGSAVTGSVVLAASLILLSLVGAGSSDLLVIGGLALSGFGLGAALPAMSSTVANSVDERDLGMAGATQQLMAQVSGAMGVQVLEAITAVSPGRSGYAHAYLVAAGVAAMAGVVSLAIRPMTDDERAARGR